MAPLIGPAASDWPDLTIAWCQRCDRPIRNGQPYETMSGGRSSREGFRHQHCPPTLRVVR